MSLTPFAAVGRAAGWAAAQRLAISLGTMFSLLDADSA